VKPGTGLALLTLALALVGSSCASSDSKPRDADEPREANAYEPSAPNASPADPRDYGRQAEAAVRAYYAALNSKDYEAAWAWLKPGLRERFGGFAAWKGGFKTTLSTKVTSVTAVDATRSAATVQLKLRSQDFDACGDDVAQRFSGTWRLSPASGRWLAAEVSMRRTAGRAPTIDASSCSGSGRTPEGSVGGGSSNSKVCYPGFTLRAVTLPAVRIPATTIPGFRIDGHRYPAQHLPAQTIPAQTIPAQHVGRTCIEVADEFAPEDTTVRVDDYEEVDPQYSSTLSTRYWSASPEGQIPDPSAPGFGEYNDAGFPKNQYVRPYVRRDGTYVGGYWRNSPTDGLPTCRVISC
jgi:hypothetical protein